MCVCFPHVPELNSTSGLTANLNLPFMYSYIFFLLTYLLIPLYSKFDSNF